MRLDDLRRRGDSEIPEDVARELDALDAALRGEELPPGMEGIEALVSDLQASKPEPEPRFEAELDAWAAAGFPRGERPGARAAGGGLKDSGFLARLRPDGPRGWAPLAATAATLVVVGVSISQLDLEGGGDSAGTGGDVAQTEVAPEDGETGVPAPPAAAESDDAADLGEVLEGADGDATNQELSPSDVRATKADESSGAAVPFAENADRIGNNRAQEKRRVDREAQLTLAAPADEVADVNDQVIDVVEGANGVVLNSRVTGTDESARATLEVEVPSATLDDTLAAMSGLANVQSRTEQSVDITRSYVTAKDRLVGLRASRDNLAARIREADTDEEVAALQAQLASVNRQIADAKNELAKVENRAQFATVTVVITSEGAGAEDGDDGWSFGDALDDAGKVLEVGAGVALISAAVLLPLAIIAAIAYVIVSAANRRSRERALDD